MPPNGPKTSVKKRGRRAVVSVQGPSIRDQASELLASPGFGWALLISVAFVFGAGIVGVWTREQPLVQVGRVMDQTVTARVDFTIQDDTQTEKDRDAARNRTPRVFVADRAVIDQIGASLEQLPTTLASVETLDDLTAEVRAPFRLTEDGFAAVRAAADQPQKWNSSVDQLVRALDRFPMLSADDWQVAMQQGLNPQIELRSNSQLFFRPRVKDFVFSIDEPAELERIAESIVESSGFAEGVRPVVVKRLITDAKPTYRFDPAATTTAQNAAADAVETTVELNPAGTPIFVRGQTLTPSQQERYRAEQRAFRASAGAWRIWVPRVSLIAAFGAVTLAGVTYIAIFCPRIRRNPTRMTGVALLVGISFAVACIATVSNPGLAILTAVAPVVFAAVLLVIAYDQRTALAIGGLLALITALALREPIGLYALAMAGIGAAVWRLHEIRDRRTIIAMAGWTGGILAAGSIIIGFVQRPIDPAVVREIVNDAALAGFGGVLVGMLAMFLLHMIERWFEITTGMTLIELRDPKQPLLRELQQRAPGTYNHSLNVASIAETAADVVGASSLLTYVGALYHDIGKMNKPEYFIENRSGGPNKHEKLSPAMSLLVIVGHVKDGLEMAREYRLPRTLQHFIEAHHGTTLVEYFYERARLQAKAEAEGEAADAPGQPQEIEYRYPGPKPRTKEVAIVMLSDAVESATRSLPEPTPSRIDQLVRTIANKRLLDGQFDECDLTLKELRIIADSISKSVAAIYHGRIAYPSDKKEEEKKAARA